MNKGYYLVLLTDVHNRREVVCMARIQVRKMYSNFIVISFKYICAVIEKGLIWFTGYFLSNCQNHVKMLRNYLLIWKKKKKNSVVLHKLLHFEWKVYFHLLPWNLKSWPTGSVLASSGLLSQCMSCSVCCCSYCEWCVSVNSTGCTDTVFLAAIHKLSEVVGPPEEWWIALTKTLLPPFIKDEEGSRQGALCLHSFLDLP